MGRDYFSEYTATCKALCLNANIYTPVAASARRALRKRFCEVTWRTFRRSSKLTWSSQLRRYRCAIVVWGAERCNIWHVCWSWPCDSDKKTTIRWKECLSSKPSRCFHEYQISVLLTLRIVMSKETRVIIEKLLKSLDLTIRFYPAVSMVWLSGSFSDRLSTENHFLCLSYTLVLLKNLYTSRPIEKFVVWSKLKIVREVDKKVVEN